MQDGEPMLVLKGFQLFVIHGAVGGAEIHGALGYLLDPTAGTYGLVIDLNVSVFFVVLVEPLGIHGVGEGGTCARDGKCISRQNYAGQYQTSQKNACASLHPSAPLERFVIAQGLRVSLFRVTALLQ